MSAAWDSSAAMDARAERRLRVLQRLVEIGLGAVEALHEQSVERVAAGEPTVDLALAHARVARAVRQTLALEARFDRDRRAWMEHQAKAAPTGDEPTSEAVLDRLHARMRTLIRMPLLREAVRQAVRASADGDNAERLLSDLDERLNDPSDDVDFANTPMSEMVERFCERLGIVPDWSLWDDAQWTVEEAQPPERESAFAITQPRGNSEGGRDPP